MSAAQAKIHPKTEMGPVHYTVADLRKQMAFYQDVLGFALLWQDGDTAALGAGSRELLRMTERPGSRRVRGTTGLYHTAFLVPTRWELAHLVRQIAETRTPVQGTSNHGTHLAIYLPDPEGNGIELAWDFPKDAWPMKNGKMDLRDMRRGGVDIDELFTELDRDPSAWKGLDPQTCVGHVHLHVADLDASERFYHDVLGFDITMKSHEFGALFVSAGGYHHHIGMNIWRGVGLPPAPDDATGLRTFSVVLPDETHLQIVVDRMHQAGIKTEPVPDGQLCFDPSGIGLILST